MEKPPRSQRRIRGWTQRPFPTVVQPHGSPSPAPLLVCSCLLAGSTAWVSSRNTIRHISWRSIRHQTSPGFLLCKVGHHCAIGSRWPADDDGSFLHAVWWTICRQDLRRLWPSLPPVRRRIPTRVWLDDDEHFEEVLSISSKPSHLLGHRSLDAFLPGFYMCECGPIIRLQALIRLLGIDMVPRKERRRPRLGCSRIVSRRRHSPHHGRSPNSRSWVRLGNADLRLSDICTACVRQFDGAFPHRANEAPL